MRKIAILFIMVGLICLIVAGFVACAPTTDNYVAPAQQDSFDYQPVGKWVDTDNGVTCYWRGGTMVCFTPDQLGK